MFLLKKNNTLEKSHGSSWCIFFSPYPYSTDQPSFDLCLRFPESFCLDLGVCSLRPGFRVCFEGFHSWFSTVKILCLVIFLWSLIISLHRVIFTSHLERMGTRRAFEMDNTILPQDFCPCHGVCWTSDQEESVMCFPPFSRSSCRLILRIYKIVDSQSCID